MATRGRKPKPLRLKILEGYRADRTNFAEPRIAAGSLDPPDWLDDYAREHWAELAAILSASGMLTAGDRPALAQLCDDYSTIRKSIKGPEAARGIALSWEAARAIVANADKARDRYRRLLTEFGLTPSSRSRIKSTLEPPKDKMAEFLERQKKKKA